MPLYLFKCPQCDETREELVRIGTESTTCTQCGTATEKQLSMNVVALGLPNGFAATKRGTRGK